MGVNNLMFNMVPVIVTVGFIIVFGLVLFNIFKGIKTWNYNNNQPVLAVQSKVVSKRIKMSESINHNDNMVSHSHTTSYYITFEVESGDRMEFRVNGNEYGLIAEGDRGKLTFQGTRYKDFLRDRQGE
jgi:hypothetical protein